MTWGIKHEAMETIYKGAIMPLLMYGAPVWIEAMNHDYNRRKYIRVQRLINISMAKVYRTTSSEALCMVTAMTPTTIKLEEIVKRYNTNKRMSSGLIELDHEVEYKYWPHPADVEPIVEVVGEEEATLKAFTDGSKQEKGVGAGAVVFKGSELVAKVQQKLDNRCSNNQVEQLAILKVLETIALINSNSVNPSTAIIFTDSRVSLDLLHAPNNHAYLVTEIRKKLTSMVKAKWKIKFSWVKTHVGIFGNEMADRLAKEAARDDETSYEFSRILISALYREAAEEALIKWQEQWAKTSKAEATKQFPNSKEQDRYKNSPNSKTNCGPNWSWENEGIFTQV
jgi:ribonuclease HI